MARIEDLPLATPVYNDIDLFADISDSNNAKSNTIGSKVKAWLADPAVTADDLQDWATKKVLTAAERTKLAGIQAGAQVNTVTSVNWQMGIVVLDADDIADTATRKMGNEIFDTSEKNKLDTAYTHSQAVTGNPHNVTAAQVWLGNVANERQLSRTAGNFNALPLKTDIQRNMNDLVPIQDAFDNDIIKKVTVGTQYIRYSSTIQLWRPSVNYHADTLVNSTTYEIRNIVIDEVTGGMYYCTISHQSGANFASDLALWYWTPVLAWGGGSSPVYVIRWASNPTQAIPWWPRTPSGAFAGQLFANTVTADILVRDGNDRVLNSAWGGWSWVTITVWVWAPVGSGTNPWDMYIDYNTANIYVWNGTSWVVNNATGGSWSWIIYSLANGTVVASTTGDRWLASTGIGADKTYETSQEIDPLTWNTINMNFWPWGTVVFDDTDINFENWTTLNYDSTVVSNHNGDTVNYDWSTINSENTEYNHTWDTINYDATTTVDWGTFVNNEFNNATFTGTITWAWAIGADEKLQATWTTINQVIPLTTIPRSWIKSLQITVIGWILQISPTDYSYNTITNEITMLVAPWASTDIEIQYPIKDSLVALPADTLQVTQTAHWFVALDWIRYDEWTSTWVKAQADTVWNLGSWHIVSIIDANTFLISKDGTHNIPNSLAPWEYVLSDATAGAYTQTLPSNPSSYILYGMEVIDTNTVNFYTVIGTSASSVSNYWTWTIFVSSPLTGNTQNITHWLTLSSTDISEWRYEVKVTYTNSWSWNGEVHLPWQNTTAQEVKQSWWLSWNNVLLSTTNVWINMSGIVASPTNVRILINKLR